MANQFDIFQIKTEINTVIRNQAMLNVQHYRLSGTGTSIPTDKLAPSLAEGFENWVLGDWRNLCTVATEILSVEIVNLADPSDFFIGLNGALPHPITGLRAGETLPLPNTLTFRLERSAIGKRSGFKRYSGISEDDVVGAAIAPGFVANVNAMNVALARIIPGPGYAEDYSPVIATRPIILGFNPVVEPFYTVTFAGIGTQVSRKVAFT